LTQEARVYPENGASIFNYLLYLPERYGHDPTQRWPLILFLHGRGESGTDPQVIKNYGLPRLIDEQSHFSFVVVSPQCSDETRWTDHADELIALLDNTISNFAVDQSRVYLTGLSMGGEGAWYLGTLHPSRFAAIVPICGPIPEFPGFPEKVCALQDVPIWVFHGAKDDRVPVSNSEVLAATLKESGGNVRLTIYPEAGHNSWDAAYSDPELYQWFLKHTRG